MVNVLCGAPFGYRYITKHEGGGRARYEILLDEARVVRQVFDWVGRERVSIGEVARRLTQAGERTRTGKTVWDRSTVWGILKNPAYKGTAAFGKTRAAELRPRLRTQRSRGEPFPLSTCPRTSGLECRCRPWSPRSCLRPCRSSWRRIASGRGKGNVEPASSYKG